MNTVEALHVGNSGENVISVPWASREIAHNNVYISASQTGKCLLSSAAINPFTQKLSSIVEQNTLSAGEPGKVSGPARVKVPRGFECGFVKDARRSDVLQPRGLVGVGERAFNRCPLPAEEGYQDSVDLQNNYNNHVIEVLGTVEIGIRLGLAIWG